jgi:hypothetical protein
LNNIIGILLKDTLSALDRQINLRMGKNSSYDQSNILNIILWASVNHTSVESSVFELKETNKKKKIPSEDIVFHHIERQIYSELQIQLENLVNFSGQMAERRRLFGKYAAVAIDIHDIPYYGKVNNSLIMAASTKTELLIVINTQL